jgi:hypothetical protein
VPRLTDAFEPVQVRQLRRVHTNRVDSSIRSDGLEDTWRRPVVWRPRRRLGGGSLSGSAMDPSGEAEPTHFLNLLG